MIEILKTAPEAMILREENNGIFAYTVSARAVDTFSPDCAVRLTVTPTADVRARMAIVLYSPHWCRPEFGDTLSDIPNNTQGLLWQETDGKYVFLLPLSDGGYVTSLESRDGELTAVIRSGCDNLDYCDTLALIAGEGENPYALMRACAEEAARRLGGGFKMREGRRYPEIFEYLGWCTWDSMEIWVNETEILEKCEEFREKQIPIRWAILDDMWADIEWERELPRFTPHEISFGVMHASKMRDYEADPDRFPHGLAGCIGRMREDYGLHVGVWHPTCGYWAGLVPGSAADEKLAGLTVTVPSGRILPDLGDAGHAYQYYARMHAFFAEAGAEFVKIDNQSFLRQNYRNVTPLGVAAANLHAGTEASVGRFFDGALINCMGMATENMLSRTASAVSRCSDDFQPENRAWFAKHIMQCAYNGLLQGQFYVNDWDMWWSDDEQAVKNSILRALSGGPIYVSDRIGRSRAEIFHPLCFSDGRILRPDRAAVPTEDCLLSDMTAVARPIKVMNTAGKTAYVGAFNLHTDGTAVVGSLSPTEIPDFAGEKFVLYEHFSGAWQILSREESVSFTLRDADDFRLYSLTPIACGTAVLGDTTKFIAARAVTDEADGFVRLYEGGRLTLYSETPIVSATDGSGNPLDVQSDGNLYTVFTPDGVVKYSR